MKIDWNRKYTTISVYALIVTFLSMVFYFGITKFSSVSSIFSTFSAIMRPFVLGFALAYIFNFILVFYEDELINKIAKNEMKFKVKRAISLILTYITVFLVIALFLKFILPQVASSLSILLTDFPKITEGAYKSYSGIISELNMSPEARHIFDSKASEMAKKTVEFGTNLMPYFANIFLNVVKSIWNTVLGVIISIYILADKEGFFAMSKKFSMAIFPLEVSEKMIYITRLSNQIFGRFIAGKILDSTIIAAITFIVLSITKMPYTVLITFIIGVTNIIPFFGPFIGAIPSVMIVMLVDPIKALWLIIIIFIIQQLDGNVIGPKILGDSIGISSFWILFSLLIAGKFFGIVGMIIGVPLFAVIYTLVTEVVNVKLRDKGLPTDKDSYRD